MVSFTECMDGLDNPLKEDHLVQIDKANILCILTETLAAHGQAIFLSQTMYV